MRSKVYEGIVTSCESGVVSVDLWRNDERYTGSLLLTDFPEHERSILREGIEVYVYVTGERYDGRVCKYTVKASDIKRAKMQAKEWRKCLRKVRYD